ncbi:hypothetical protein HPB49_011614 [Dermacentor silvarum]|uniref:Uncharacterized protein n=1 Tax=Dermacentor silvarum TaxID=543639 RepID=A0ACB8DZP2_DERSI|nr:hypothetical protein HPB49_011614 [Dermacentor silvarum]
MTWTSAFSKRTIQSDRVWPYLLSKTAAVRQAHRGSALKEEDYVKNVIYLETADASAGLVRATCAPSKKSGVYVVEKHCRCVPE